MNDRNGATQTHFRNGKKPVKPLPRPAFRRQCVGKGINSFIIILFSMMIISQSRHFTFCFPEQVEKGGKRKRKQLGGGETQNRGPVSFLRMVEHVTNVDKTFPSSDDEDSIKVEGFFLVFLPHSRENKTSLIQEEASTTHFCGLFF